VSSWEHPSWAIVSNTLTYAFSILFRNSVRKTLCGRKKSQKKISINLITYTSKETKTSAAKKQKQNKKTQY
jgi:hypothetical protein